MDACPQLDAAFHFTSGLKKEVKLCTPRTSDSELFTRGMVCRAGSNDRRLTPELTGIGEFSLPDPVGFEPGAE